jgi:hypothetical protein
MFDDNLASMEDKINDQNALVQSNVNELAVTQKQLKKLES